MFIEPFFRSLPLALPTIIGSGVLAVLGAPWWARWLQVPRATAVLFIAVCGAYLGVTATPTEVGLWSTPGGSRGVSLDIQLPPLGNLLMITSDSLNVLAGATLGAVSVLMWCAGRRGVAVGTAVGLPLLVELVQLLFPAMGRVGFMLSDVVLNWIGAGLGAGLGATLAVAIGVASSVKTVPE